MRSRSATVVALALTVAFAVAKPAPSIALNDPEYAQQWGTEIIGAKAAWDAGLLGQGARIAVLDTGVHFGHFEFSGRVVSGPNYIDPTKSSQDDGHDIVSGKPQGHGTHVAGIAAAGIDQGGTVGVAPAATIVAVKVLDREGTGRTSEILKALRWAADSGAEVINLSLGSIGPQFFDDPATIATVEYAWKKGSIVVFAAGNNYVFGTEYTNLSAIVVAATTRNDGKAYFSSTVTNTKWALAAPGGAATPTAGSTERIFAPAWESDTQNNTYRHLQGTSQAAPHVAGAAAVLRSAGLTPQQTVDRLLSTAKDLGVPGRDDTFGAGRLDVAKAVAGLSSGGLPATTTPTSPPTTSAAPPPPATAVPPGAPTSTRPSGRRPAPTAPAGASPVPTAPTEPMAAPTDTAAEATTEPDRVIESGPTGLEALAAEPPVRRPAPDDEVSAPLVALASLAAATTAGWALWLVWRRRRDEPAR